VEPSAFERHFDSRNRRAEADAAPNRPTILPNQTAAAMDWALSHSGKWQRFVLLAAGTFAGNPETADAEALSQL
jgi:hypothetical protein